VSTGRKSVSSAHKLDGLGKLKEHAPRSEHLHLHQDIGHIRKNHLQATLLPQLSKYAQAISTYIAHNMFGQADQDGDTVVH